MCRAASGSSPAGGPTAGAEAQFGLSCALEPITAKFIRSFGAHDPTMIPTVELLNRVRNQVAHSFDLDRSLVDELLRINSGDYPTYRPKNDRERIRGLKLICAFVSGYVSGLILSHYYHDKERRESVDSPR